MKKTIQNINNNSRYQSYVNDMTNTLKEMKSTYIDECDSVYINKTNEAKKVSSEKYIDWIYNFVSKNNRIDSENILYTFGTDDNIYFLGDFFNYVLNLANIQNIEIKSDKECDFPNELIFVKIRDRYFELFRMFGQASLIQIELMQEQPYCDCVVIV